jgi:circadian clock protein KaiB
MTKMRLELFVVGQSARSMAAVANLRRILDTNLAGQFDLQIIDVLEQPDAAEDSNIMATPTLIKREPDPTWRLLGDLSETEVVLRRFGIDASDDEKGHGGKDE